MPTAFDSCPVRDASPGTKLAELKQRYENMAKGPRTALDALVLREDGRGLAAELDAAASGASLADRAALYWMRWQSLRAFGMDPAEERKAFDDCVREVARSTGASATIGWLEGLLKAAAADGHLFALRAAAEAQLALLAGDEHRQARLAARGAIAYACMKKRRAVIRFVVGGEREAPVDRPYAETAFRSFLAELDTPERVRAAAEGAVTEGHLPLGDMAYARLVELVGEDALTEKDLLNFAGCSPDAMANVERLEAFVQRIGNEEASPEVLAALVAQSAAAEDSERVARWLQALEAANPPGELRARARCDAGEHYFAVGEYRRALELFRSVWPELRGTAASSRAKRYLKRMNQPLAQ